MIYDVNELQTLINFHNGIWLPINYIVSQLLKRFKERHQITIFSLRITRLNADDCKITSKDLQGTFHKRLMLWLIRKDFNIHKLFLFLLQLSFDVQDMLGRSIMTDLLIFLLSRRTSFRAIRNLQITSLSSCLLLSAFMNYEFSFEPLAACVSSSSA